MPSTHLDTALAYLRELEQGATGEALARFFHPEVAYREYPNRLFPSGVSSDLRGMLEASERGQKAVGEQRFTVRHALADGDSVALELDWSGTLKIGRGPLTAGTTLRAAFGVFLTFREGRIHTQHNYDCYEPF
ncbi:nuclear transport factor 2 family protein [Hyalangium rubrum]|uniref:Nuclear transport factor 2 family protein n=1 Tax=Hyalangium rubrum TaxID=3103134 RepID=A0ABU5H4E4_9BACT|nr:nuclear transport factor 2 family protein [Hyalangium sp. s54d21]MDY7227964.1 nuclear transport factor 2 family protein [Hyalangium sp. s54d21]